MEYYDRDGIGNTVSGRSVEKYLIHTLSWWRLSPEKVLPRETKPTAPKTNYAMTIDKARFPLPSNCEIAVYIRSLEALCKV